MKDILIIYAIPTEIVNAILMLYKNTRSMVRSPDGDTPFFDITTGVLQGNTHSPFIFIRIICLDYILKKSLDGNANQYRLHSYKKQEIPSCTYYRY